MKPSNYENKNSNYNYNNKQEQTNTTTRVENCYPNKKQHLKIARDVTALKRMLRKTGNENLAVRTRTILSYISMPCCLHELQLQSLTEYL